VAGGESVNQESGEATRVADAVDEFTKLFLLVSTNGGKKRSTGTDSGTMLHSRAAMERAWKTMGAGNTFRGR